MTTPNVTTQEQMGQPPQVPPVATAVSPAPDDRSPKPSQTTDASTVLPLPAMSAAEAEKVIESAADASRRLTESRRTSNLATAAGSVARGIRVADPAEIARYEQWLEARKRAERVAACHLQSYVPEHYRDAWLEDHGRLPTEVWDAYRGAVRKLSPALRKPGLWPLIGGVGTGKTFMACALIRAFCDSGRSAKYMKTMDYIAGYRATWKSDAPMAELGFEDRHVRIALLVLDEWQVRGGTDNENLILLRLLDKRYDAGKTTVLVSNHATKEEFEQTIDARVADRICDGGGVIICDWESLRGRLKA